MTFRLVGCEHEIDKESCCIVHEEGTECPICEIEMKMNLDFGEIVDEVDRLQNQVQELQDKLYDMEIDQGDLLKEREMLKDELEYMQSNQ